ncbi:NAD-dependent epimerase/dehydratase family protein [Pseudoduganella danionis]|uniref:NAD-dependent epimerase/dehydratase family protein n=1 Tax=Pseudoduganella danionis TaxID=1890295 RepID=A0ABW9SVA9_9BURK|nr:NAD(P)-dependent oxidoreductase [Pseudoduganella danionis]MTW35083.1 NAD-dependent epimerase/dehydratase family protein [Pseudoduganella danionis]
MQHLAILGASSQIARDLICSLAQEGRSQLLLYGRDTAAIMAWQQAHGLNYPVYHYADYGQQAHDAVLNFVGVGDPQRAAQLGGAIFSLTQQFDDLVLQQLAQHPQRRYIFLSSGAAYGARFEQPAGPDTLASVPINALQPQDYYAVAKLHAECKHRALAPLAITDLRVFNYFSRSQDLAARFFITDILRAIRAGSVLDTSAASMVRDYLHPADLHQLVRCVLDGPPLNQALDCYSAAPIAKQPLLDAMQQHFGLRYQVSPAPAGLVNATGSKPNYYSTQRLAAELGYQPRYSSLDGIVQESAIILARDAT